jgi:hypothetical protein
MKAIEKPQAIIYITLFILLAIIAFMFITTGCTSEQITDVNHMQVYFSSLPVTSC